MNLQTIDRKLKKYQKQTNDAGNGPTLEQWRAGDYDPDTAAIYEQRRAQAMQTLLDFGEDILTRIAPGDCSPNVNKY
jgi:hypothetical protein